MIHVQNFIVAALFAMMGVGALWRPETFLTPLGLRAETADARNEVQAVYGGFGLAMAGILVAPIGAPGLGDGPATFAAAALLGMAGGRLVALCRERSGRMPVVFLVIELASAIVLLSGVRSFSVAIGG